VRKFLLGPVVRLIPIGLVFLGIQRKVCAPYRPFDVVVNVVLILVVGAGAGGGPQRGALAGFILGMMFDLAVGSPLGSSALAFGLGGLVAGYVTTLTPDPQWWLAGSFAAAGAVVGEGAIPVIKLLTGEDGWITPRLLVVLPVQAVAALVLSPLLIPLGRWCMAVKRRKWKAILE
jgi:cell shape-determining protein MreD